MLDSLPNLMHSVLGPLSSCIECTLKCTAIHCNNTLPYTAAIHCDTLQQYTAIHCNNTLQYTATIHCKITAARGNYLCYLEYQSTWSLCHLVATHKRRRNLVQLCNRREAQYYPNSLYSPSNSSPAVSTHKSPIRQHVLSRAISTCVDLRFR